MKLFFGFLCLVNILPLHQAMASEQKVEAFLADDISPFATRGRVDFGKVKRGQPTTENIRITNDTYKTVKLKRPVVEGTVFRVANYCGSSLAPGAFCNLFVTFDTKQNPGTYSGRISIDATGIDDLIFELRGEIVDSQP